MVEDLTVRTYVNSGPRVINLCVPIRLCRDGFFWLNNTASSARSTSLANSKQCTVDHQEHPTFSRMAFRGPLNAYFATMPSSPKTHLTAADTTIFKCRAWDCHKEMRTIEHRSYFLKHPYDETSGESEARYNQMRDLCCPTCFEYWYTARTHCCNVHRVTLVPNEPPRDAGTGSLPAYLFRIAVTGTCGNNGGQYGQHHACQSTICNECQTVFEMSVKTWAGVRKHQIGKDPFCSACVAVNQQSVPCAECGTKMQCFSKHAERCEKCVRPLCEACVKPYTKCANHHILCEPCRKTHAIPCPNCKVPACWQARKLVECADCKHTMCAQCAPEPATCCDAVVCDTCMPAHSDRRETCGKCAMQIASCEITYRCAAHGDTPLCESCLPTLLQTDIHHMHRCHYTHRCTVCTQRAVCVTPMTFTCRGCSFQDTVNLCCRDTNAPILKCKIGVICRECTGFWCHSCSRRSIVRCIYCKASYCNEGTRMGCNGGTASAPRIQNRACEDCHRACTLIARWYKAFLYEPSSLFMVRRAQLWYTRLGQDDDGYSDEDDDNNIIQTP